MNKNSKNTENEKPKDKDKEKDKEKSRGLSRAQRVWTLSITICAFCLSVFMTLFSDMLMRNTNIVVAFIVLIVIVLIGIVFDIIGVAVTVADPAPFNSMASAKLKGARSSLRLISNAPKVSSVCNDVVGDTCGIISGTSAAYIVTQLSEAGFMDYAVLSLLLSGIVASLTIGGKAMGKEFAISRSKIIVTRIGQIIAFFTEH